MSILNVDKIQPIGGGSTITVDATDIQVSTGTIRASTFSGDVSATGIGVTSLNIAGVTTASGNIKLVDNVKATFGNSGDLEIYHDGSTNYIRSNNGAIVLRDDTIQLKAYSTTDTYVSCVNGGAVSLRYDNSVKLTTETSGVNITGICTATSFVGSGANLTNLPAQITFSNPSNNRILTSEGGIGVNAESNFTYDGSLLTTQKRMVIGNGTDFQIPSRSNTSSYTPQLQVTGAWNDPTHGATMALNGRTDYPLLWLKSGASFANNSGAGYIIFSIKDGAGNYCNTSAIRSRVDGTVGNNTSPGALIFQTASAGTCQNSDRMTINSSGDIRIHDGMLALNLTTPKTSRGIHISKGTGNGGIGNNYSLANEYLHFGYSEYNSSGSMGLFTMGFGYVGGGTPATNSPAYLGYRETSTSGYTNGALVFATRNVTTNTAPTERMRIKSNGEMQLNDSTLRYENTGGNFNQVRHLEFPIYFSSGAIHTVATIGGSMDSGFVAFATLEYIGLYGYAGQDMSGGVRRAYTRRNNNNSGWRNFNNQVSENVGENYRPNIEWDNGVLKVTTPGSTQITGYIRITAHAISMSSFTLTRN